MDKFFKVPIDIIQLIIDNKITEKEAQEMEEYFIQNPQNPDDYFLDIHYDIFSMTENEVNARLGGASFKAISHLRNTGFPDICDICHKKINLDEDLWMLRVNEESDTITNFHIDCIDKDPLFLKNAQVIKVETIKNKDEIKTKAYYDSNNYEISLLTDKYSDNNHKNISLYSLEGGQNIDISMGLSQKDHLRKLTIVSDRWDIDDTLKLPEDIEYCDVKISRLENKYYDKFPLYDDFTGSIYIATNYKKNLIYFKIRDEEVFKNIGLGKNLILQLNKDSELIGLWIKNIHFYSKSFKDISIHQAALEGNWEVLETIILEGGNVNSRLDIKNFLPGETPLHWATNEKVVNILVNNGANVDIKDKDGWTPLHRSVFMGYPKVTKALLTHNANINARDNNQWTPLHWVWKKNIANLLLEKGADINAIEKRGWTPLHRNAFWGNIELVEFFFSKGANLSTKDNEGKTPLQLAIEANNKEIIAFLIDKEN